MSNFGYGISVENGIFPEWNLKTEKNLELIFQVYRFGKLQHHHHQQQQQQQLQSRCHNASWEFYNMVNMNF